MAKRSTYSRKLPDYNVHSKADLRQIGATLVDKYLRAKKKGQTVQKIPTGRTSVKSFACK